MHSILVLPASVVLLPAFLLCLTPQLSSAGTVRHIGVARVDITPDYAIRLSGYGSRRAESEGVAQRIWAKALAIGSDDEGPAVLITVDNCGVSAAIRADVLRRLEPRTSVTSERFAIASSHAHTAPMLFGVLPNLFSMDIPPEHQAKIERYTRELTDRLEQVALAALADRRPGHLAWGVGQAGFGNNRRTPGGPVDHDLPVLRLTGVNGGLRAVLVSYACHCTTLGGEFNQICGDWAGYAQEHLERDHPGVTALVAIGCGADQNPKPRPGLELAQRHGQEIATAVSRVLSGKLSPIEGRLACRTKLIQLPYDRLPTREEWETLSNSKSAPIAYHARKNLARLQAGLLLPTRLPYLVQVWSLGSDLAMVFLPGEVVVDYGLRLKKEFDRQRLWVNAYANDIPCYIPSRRVLTEGGYEGGGAMVYYDRPTKFAAPVEQLIIEAVHELMPRQFLAP